MASYDNKGVSPEVINEKHSSEGAHDVPPPAAVDMYAPNTLLGTGPTWMYRSRKLGGLTFPFYASPVSQLLIISFVCFLCPGMFNAVNGIGAGGQVDATVADKSNAALYSTFSIVGFFAGSIVNRLGIRSTLAVSGIGYVLYIAAFLSYNHNGNAGFVVFSGAFLGACAGVLWAAQGTIMMSYPAEGDKGKYISWFWMIFNMGAVIGSLVSLHLSLRPRSCLPCR